MNPYTHLIILVPAPLLKLFLTSWSIHFQYSGIDYWRSYFSSSIASILRINPWIFLSKILSFFISVNILYCSVLLLVFSLENTVTYNISCSSIVKVLLSIYIILTNSLRISYIEKLSYMIVQSKLYLLLFLKNTNGLILHLFYFLDIILNTRSIFLLSANYIFKRFYPYTMLVVFLFFF